MSESLLYRSPALSVGNLHLNVIGETHSEELLGLIEPFLYDWTGMYDSYLPAYFQMYILTHTCIHTHTYIHTDAHNNTHTRMLTLTYKRT